MMKAKVKTSTFFHEISKATKSFVSICHNMKIHMPRNHFLVNLRIYKNGGKFSAILYPCCGELQKQEIINPYIFFFKKKDMSGLGF